MTHTRFSPRNIGLLFACALVCVLNAFLVSLTSGFGTDPVRDFRTFAAAIVLYISLLSVPFCLALFRWSGVAAKAMWIVTLCCSVLILIAAQDLLFFVFPLLLQSVLAGLVDSGSRVNSDVQNPE